ncbi:hypothetical protein WIW50_10255 [Flavobacteriaceae bacterium 3-367]|uniref:hypothetical protein n=1 Tax=Eudoraea algarum TaxID=3417568 RepID=UPI003271BF3A
MDDSLEHTFKTLEKITDLRYKSDQRLIDIVQSQLERSSTATMKPLVNGGMNFLNSMLENRHDLERSVLRKIKKEAEKNTDSNTAQTPGTDVPSEPAIIDSGTFMVRSFLSQKKVQIPLNINNVHEVSQEVVVDLGELKNMRTGEVVKNKISADKTLIVLPPKKKDQLKISIDLKSGLRVQNQYFATLILKGNEHRVFQVILEVLSAKNKKEKASLTFLPPQQS